MKSLNRLIAIILFIVCVHCTKDAINKGTNQYVVFPYAFKSDGSNTIKDSFILASYGDTVRSYGMAFTPAKNGKVFMVAFKLAAAPSPPDNNVILYLVDVAANKIVYSTVVNYPGTDFYRKDLTVTGEEVMVEKDKTYMVCAYTPVVNSINRQFIPGFRIYRIDQKPVVPFTTGDITVSGFFKNYPSSPNIPNIPIEDINGLYGLLDLGYYSIE
ncbi:MAG: hypothetical protein ACKVOW_16605 [Chitinophagaceae bacterium]